MAGRKVTQKNALVRWDAAMADAAKKQKATLKVLAAGTPKIRFSGGSISIDDAVVGKEMEVIILSEVAVNEFYAEDYNPNNPMTPHCFAFSDPDSEEDPQAYMTPHADSEEPQAETCRKCAQNVFGSAARGNGKACKNIRKLAIVLPEAMTDADAMRTAEIRTANVPVTSVKNLAKYAQTIIDDYQRPLYGVVTRICTDSDPRTQIKVWFEMVEVIEMTQDLWAALQEKVAKANETLITPYAKPSEVAERQSQRESAGARGKPLRPVGRAAVAVAKQKTKLGAAPAKAVRK